MQEDSRSDQSYLHQPGFRPGFWSRLGELPTALMVRATLHQPARVVWTAGPQGFDFP